jgi:hypothetical protein
MLTKFKIKAFQKKVVHFHKIIFYVMSAFFVMVNVFHLLYKVNSTFRAEYVFYWTKIKLIRKFVIYVGFRSAIVF